MDLTLQQVLFRLVALLAIAAVHGAALAWSAGWLGDPGPRYDGRRTLNPFAHLDIVGGLGLVIFGYGWIKPVALDDRELRFGRLGRALVAVAGILAVLLLAAVAEALRRPLILAMAGNLPLYGIVLLQTVSTLSIAFALINLLPLPLLTGANFLTALFPALDPIFTRYRTVFVILVAAFIASGGADRLFLPVYRPVSRFLLGA